MRMNENQKATHRTNLLAIGTAAIRHALVTVRSMTPNPDLITGIIEQRLDAVRNELFDADEIKKLRKKRFGNQWEYSPENRLLEASEELILLADYGGHLSGGRLREVMVPCWDAIGIVDQVKQSEETEWQDRVLEPLIEKAFEHMGEKLEIK